MLSFRLAHNCGLSAISRIGLYSVAKAVRGCCRLPELSNSEGGSKI